MPARRKPLATHGRTIHSGQSRHFDSAPRTSALLRSAESPIGCVRSEKCQSRPKCAAANCAGDHLIDTNMRHSEAKHPGGLMVDDTSNLAGCTTPRLGVGAALP